MNFDEWFYSQSKMVQIILLFIPVVGWIVEILVRLSALIKHKCNINVAGLIVYFLIGWAWIPAIIDILFVAATDNLMFCKTDNYKKDVLH